MASLQENLELLKSISANPKKQLDNYIAAGKKVVGCFPVYTPEVMVHAADMVPMGLWGAQTEISSARNYLPPFACPIMQSCLELGLNGIYEGISCVMIPAMCDTFRCITQDWKRGVTSIPCIPFTFPQNRVMEESITFFMDELSYVKESIEKYCDVKITEEAMQASLAVYNHHMAVMNDFCAVANEHLDIIDAVTRHAVMKSATFMDKAEHAAIVEEIIDGLKTEPVCDWKGKKVVLTGITAEPDALLQVLVDNKVAVVADDVAQESRQYSTPFPACNSAIESLARQWQNRTSDPLAHEDKLGRSDLLIRLTKEKNATGVILCLMKFCDPEEYEETMIKPELKALGIPVLTIDIDQQPTSYDQARTRIQTFADII